MKVIKRKRLGTKLFLIYIVGGLLPLIFTSLYLIRGTEKILISQAKNTEMVELEGIKNEILEMQNTFTIVSQYFYFDSELEHMSTYQYEDYNELINDYRQYKTFKTYQNFYNNSISRISIFMNNNSLVSNSNFIVVDDKISREEWYKKVSNNKNVVVWTYLPTDEYRGERTLALTRMIKTKKGQNVGALAIYVKPERLNKFLLEREGTAYILLNRNAVVTSKGNDVEISDVKKYIPENIENNWQGTVCVSDKEYVMTVQNIYQKDTTDYLQIVSIRAIEDIISDANRYKIRSWEICLVFVIFAILIISGFSYYYGVRIGKFKLQMQKAAAGSFELEPHIGGNDEISELYDYLGIMLYNIQKLLAGIYQEKIHAEQLKTKQKDAEFKMLTSQINPHFLYNTLETIRMKAVINKQDDIEELVSRLAKILRSAINAGEKEITLSAEIELIDCYLKIQQYRFGDRLQYHIEMEENLGDCGMLPLIMQPIVENAIIHGLENVEEMWRIEIDASSDGNDIVILIEDNGIGIDNEKLLQIREELNSNRLKGEHIGIFNVQYRIKLKYGANYGLSIESEENYGTRVEIRLPKQE